MGNSQPRDTNCFGNDRDRYSSFEPTSSYTSSYTTSPFNRSENNAAGALIVGAVKSVANIATTTVSAIADNRTYYNCPRCKREVYAYGSFAGNVCLDCPGTVISGVGSTLSMVTGDIIPAQKLSNCVASEVTQTVSAVCGAVGNVATLQIDDGGNGTRANWKGNIIWSSSGKSVKGDHQLESIQSVTTKSCGIRFPVFKGSGFDHWWMNIRTSDGHYQIQFRKKDSVIELRECDSAYNCDQNGLKEANRDENIAPSRQVTYSKKVNANRTVGDLMSWLESGGISGNYSLFNNNCKDLCKRIYEWI